MPETIAEEPGLQSTVGQEVGVPVTDASSRGWNELAQTYRDELPDVLHPHVERLLEAHGITAPTPGEVTVTDAVAEQTQETPIQYWRRIYGEEVTEEQAQVFDEIVAAQEQASKDHADYIATEPRSPGPGGFTDSAWAEGTTNAERYRRREAGHGLAGRLPMNTATAGFLLDRDMAPTLVDKIDDFLELTLEMAARIIKSKGAYLADSVLENHQKFPKFNQEIADTLIHRGDIGLFLANKAMFVDLQEDSDLALQILAKDKDTYSGGLLEGWPGNGSALAPARYGAADVLSMHLHAFKTLDTRVLHGLAESVEAYIDETMHDSSTIAVNVANRFDKFQDVDPQDLETIKKYSGRNWLQEYPQDTIDPETGNKKPAPESDKNRWFAEMSYTYLEGGFNKTLIGKLIRRRLESGAEKNIHDASQWLNSFHIEDTAYDAQAIIRARSDPDFDPTDIAKARLRDRQKELKFFWQLLHADPALRSRLNLSSKEGAAESLFSLPEYQLIYQTAVGRTDGQPLYKHPEFSLALLREAAEAAVPAYIEANDNGHAKEVTTHTIQEDDLYIRLDMFFDGEFSEWAMENNSHMQQGRISETVQDLKNLGEARRQYIQDAQTWLLRHATTPSERLVKVWKDRGLALMDGVEDSAVAIEHWHNVHGLKKLLDDLDVTGSLQEVYGFTKDEVMSEKNSHIREAFLPVMSGPDVLEAMKRLRDWSNQRGDMPKLLPADTIKVPVEDKKEKSLEYTLEVLADGDPRGFTIGHETGCCMTLGGESEDCIEAGYTLPNAGFIAVYPPGSDKAGAQSFWYVHPDYPDTLVLDNIEANKGRDLKKIANIYREGLANYLRQHPELGIKRVHVGMGYTEIDLGNAPIVDAVPPLNEDIYTDAETQRLLLARANER